MKTIEILGDNRFETYTKTRIGCRAVILKDDKILFSHEKISGWWLIPGGGLEEAMDIFSKHESYAGIWEEKRGAFQREFLALGEYESSRKSRL